MQTISKNNSLDTLEVHQFKSNFFIGNNNSFKLFNPKSYSKSDIKSNNINIIHFEKPPVIIPKSLFKKDNLKKYVSTNYKLSKSSDIAYDQTNNKLIYIVYERRNTLESLFNKENIEFRSINYFTTLYEYLLPLKKKDDLSIYINLRSNLFDLIIFKKNEFFYFNTFNKNNKEEFLYYLLYVLKNFEADINTSKITFLGKFEEFIDYYEYARSYAEVIFEKNKSETKNTIKHESPFFLNSLV